MKKSNELIKGTTESWEDGQLGREEEYVSKVELDESMVNDALALQMISIRLQKTLIDDLKMIGKINGIGYQPLIRQVLKRFAESEKKQILREVASKGDTIEEDAELLHAQA